jgi:hypothetical protein
MNLSEARLAVISSNPNLSPQEVEDRVQRFLAHEETQKARAEFEAAVAEQQRQEANERKKFSDGLYAAYDADQAAAAADLAKRKAAGEDMSNIQAAPRAQGPSKGVQDVIKELEAMQAAGEGW